MERKILASSLSPIHVFRCSLALLYAGKRQMRSHGVRGHAKNQQSKADFQNNLDIDLRHKVTLTC